MENPVVSLVLVVALILIVGYQQWFFTRQIQLLVDKLMSRSFAEYQQANTPIPPRNVVQVPPPIPEDLRTLQPFMRL